MNIITLDSIAKLFALAANRQNEEDTERFADVFKRFLSDEIEDRLVDKYVNDFKNYLSDYSSSGSYKRVSLNSVKLIRICEQIKVNISMTERLLIIYYLIFLIKETGCSELSIEFAALISEMFGISNEIYSELNSFINEEGKLNYKGLFVNEVCIAQILNSDFEIIFIKPIVNGLKLNDRDLLKNNVAYILKDSVLFYKDIKKFFFPDLHIITKSQDDTNVDRFHLNIRDIELKLRKKQILYKTSADFCSGELIAIVGKSGSGKTSFLKSVAGIEKKALGDVFVSGNYPLDTDFFKSFVPQIHDYIPFFTVEEHLQHRCRFLQFSKEISERKINDVLLATSLIEERKNIVCKGDKSLYQLSGGQQKRLGIAMELLHDPQVVFLDEPTSGLSSEDSYKIISLLRSLANQNKIIVASVHQPDFDIFMMFDKILIIDEGGYPVYFGQPVKAIEHFRKILNKVDKNSLIETRHNPAVILKMIEEAQFDENGIVSNRRKYSASNFYKIFVDDKPKSINGKTLSSIKTCKQNSIVSFFRQLFFSFKIDLKYKARLVLLLLIPLISGISFSFLLKYSHGNGYIYFYNPNIPVWILILLTTAIFTGLVNSGHEFIHLRSFHKHENRIIDKSQPYLFAILFKYLFLSLIQSIILVLPSVLIIGNTFHFFSLFTIVFLLIYWGSLMSLIVSALANQTSTVYLLIPLIMIPQLIFSGAMINFGDFNSVINKRGRVPWVADIVPMRWASEAVITDFYCNNEYYKDIYKCRQYVNNSVYYTDYFIPAIEEIIKNDKKKATEILENELKNPGFAAMTDDEALDTDFLKAYYVDQKNKYLMIEDSITNAKNDLKSVKMKYSNAAVNKVINNSNGANCVEIDKIIYRNYKPIYAFPGTVGLNRSFLKSYGRLLHFDMVCYIYNSLVIFFYITFFVFILFTVKFIWRRFC